MMRPWRGRGYGQGSGVSGPRRNDGNNSPGFFIQDGRGYFDNGSRGGASPVRFVIRDGKGYFIRDDPYGKGGRGSQPAQGVVGRGASQVGPARFPTQQEGAGWFARDDPYNNMNSGYHFDDNGSVGFSNGGGGCYSEYEADDCGPGGYPMEDGGGQFSDYEGPARSMPEEGQGQYYPNNRVEIPPPVAGHSGGNAPVKFHMEGGRGYFTGSRGGRNGPVKFVLDKEGRGHFVYPLMSK